MKRIYAMTVLLLATAVLVFAACTPMTTQDVADQDQVEAEASGLTIHKIGVPCYNISDAQVVMFKNYLDNYIKGCFPDVTFLYSESLTGAEDLMAFLELCAQQGVEGILAFNSYDLKAEVELCAAHEMYYIRPAGTTSDAEFESVADDPWYLGEIGPGAELEYQSGADMTKALAHAGEDEGYLILSGGAGMGNEMHRLRALAMLEELERIYGVTLQPSAETLASVEEPTVVNAGELQVAVCPGYFWRAPYDADARELVESGAFDVALSTVPVTSLMESLKKTDIRCGVVDCFSEDNFFGFHKGKIDYVAGKYPSEIGPGFAALYNAITGGAELYRPDGRAFRLEQGFWTADSQEAYDEMYGFVSGLSINAYNYEDLYSVVQSMDPDASYERFQALVGAYGYEDCLARRGA